VQRGLKSGSYAGLFEILSLGEERLARDLSERISEATPKFIRLLAGLAALIRQRSVS
jgi:hypothetical protein